MLSILIPIYNEDVVDLVRELQRQCEIEQFSYEIICIDDASDKDAQKLNKKNLLPLNVIYTELDENIGRARIRNKLIDDATYDILLFIDSDHKVTSSNFISNYSCYFGNTSYSVIYGGTIYPDKTELHSDHQLHWHYGKYREAITAEVRRLNPADHVHTNNLLVRKDQLGDIRFDQSIKDYGYEDILLAQNLYNANKDILHINNPLLHVGIKSNTAFLRDVKRASKNLATLYTQSKILNLRIIKVFKFLKSSLLLLPIILIIKYCEPLIAYTLTKAPKCLFLIDVLRLFYFVEEVQIRHKFQNR